jgi:transcriptional regulator GlxA family with amidase domain
MPAHPHTALMSRRTFTRQFRHLIEMTVVEWLQVERLALTQHLLDNCAHLVKTIPALVGFGCAPCKGGAFLWV